ncbi:alpha/beta hydrolase [Roseomonas sp. BN140053]|uniref:alpha/beta hydrolase n=1 Tax=Roseomonas sp. BN140053 TaxID=3391898 RepID=UPI0039E9D463
MHRLRALVAAASLAGFAKLSPAQAQISNLPPEIVAGIAAMGPVWNSDVLRNTSALFRPLRESQGTEGLEASKDQHYGPDARQVLDLYRPSGAAGPLPVMVFVHGGGFVRGERDPNVAMFFARQGMLGVTMTYRLAPQHPWPAAPRDVGAAIAWLRDNAARLGIDPGRIFLFGISAGATHAASYAFDPELHPSSGPGLAGLILGSGVFKVTAADTADNTRAYFGTDPSQYEARSPLTHAASSRLPLFLFTAEYDPPFLATPTLELMQLACRRDGKCPHYLQVRGHNHVSDQYSLGTADQALGGALMEFTRTLR